MLENGFFHADPHAGNLLAMPSGTVRNVQRVTVTPSLTVASVRNTTLDYGQHFLQ